MTSPSDRMREHPAQRFQTSQHSYDLDQITQALRAEPLPPSRNHRQETLYKGSDTSTGPTTIALFDFQKGAKMPQHVANGVVMIHVIDGHLSIMAEGQEHHLITNHVLVLRPGVEHDVSAVEASRMLLTVCLEITSNGSVGR